MDIYQATGMHMVLLYFPLRAVSMHQSLACMPAVAVPGRHSDHTVALPAQAPHCCGAPCTCQTERSSARATVHAYALLNLAPLCTRMLF